MFTMNTQTKVIFTAIIAVTAMLALSPLLSSNVMAIKNGASQTTESCVHNGNGQTSGGSCSGNGKSATTVEQTTYKCQGKFQSTPC
jgi:hypothetical protein